MNKGNLKPAHAGYRYQDIATAYFLIKSTLGKCDSVTVDKKQVEDDRLDDLEVVVSGNVFRKQIKSSPDASRAIKKNDFTGNQSTLRIDRLLLTHVRSPYLVKEYRLCATWQPPSSSDELINLIEPIITEPTFDGTIVKSFKLNADKIWPLGEEPIWTPLHRSIDTAVEFDRNDFVVFCDKFIIELNLPLASTNLLHPGPLENAVLKMLQEYVGIGQYPNTGRQSEDVAALAVSLATLARTQEATLFPNEVIKSLEIRTDFGRVAQAFPLDKNHFFNRTAFRDKIRSEISKDGFHIVTGPPGAGKSWDLTSLAEELSPDFIVARHYCYLEPGDELIERRVTSDVFYANIIAELYEVLPELSQELNRLSADIQTLELALKNASTLGQEIVLIVDGLDHISRVKTSSNTLSDDDTDIIERLSTLSLPKGVKVIIGSQPGEHLEPIISRKENDVFTYNLPNWNSDEVKVLARLHGVVRSLASIGIVADETVDEVLTHLAEKCDGNPLYVRYLCKGLTTAIQSGSYDTPQEWLQMSPSINGDIAVYYQYLYKKIAEQAQAIADIFGVIDFAVNREELTEIVPNIISSYIPQALTALSPILTDISAQGGFRIFHESFRRFMLDEMRAKGQSLNNVLSPVIDWLESIGFYQSSKSYRFLLPALRRAKNHNEIYRLIDHSFVATSVSHGHPIQAIQSNIAIVADVAGRECNWPIIVRCSELRRALSTCFDEGHTWDDFWFAYGQLFGEVNLAERLLFDGKPTLAREDGLLACLFVDDSGGVAPWKEYLALGDNVGESIYGEHFDTNKQLTSENEVNLAEIQGQISLGRVWSILRRFYEYLLSNIDEPAFHFIRCVSWRFSRNGYENTLLKLAQRFDSKSAIISIAIRLGIADSYKEKGDKNTAKIISDTANELITSSPIIASMCIEFGSTPQIDWNSTPTPSSFDLGIDSGFPETQYVNSWISTLRTLAFSNSGKALVKGELKRLEGIGWYKCWLRYVLELVIAESAKRSNEPYDICYIFSLLNEDVNPFSGNPRACDLYKLHGLIKESLELGLSLIKTQDEWRSVLGIIQNVSSSTATRFDQEDGGPISVGTFIDILLPYATSEVTGKMVFTSIENEIKYLNNRGSYYSTHAQYSMKRALIEHKTNQKEKALESWAEVGTYLSGYGWRKDITLFDIVETIPILSNIGSQLALEALEEVQPLIGAVLRHTDKRSTNHIPNAWFDAFLEIDPVNAIVVLARTISEEEGIESWPTISALKSVAKHLQNKAFPILVNGLWETIPFKIEYENEGQKVARERLDSVALLTPKMAQKRLVKLAAEVANDATNYKESAVKAVESAAVENNIFIECSQDLKTKTQKKETTPKRRTLPTNLGLTFEYPIFPENPSHAEIIRGIRNIGKLSESNESKVFVKLSIYLSYKIDELTSAEDHASAKRLLYFFAREVSLFSVKVHPIVYLAEALENSGLNSLASIAYALAYTQSRGGGGWYSFGGEDHKGVLEKGILLDKELAERTVAEEVSYRLRNTDYGAGITKGLMLRISEWGNHQIAADCWKEAFEVISRRLPLTSENTWFAIFRASERIHWDVNEGVVLLLLARLLEPRVSRKISALNSLMQAIIHHPESVSRPLNWWLCRDSKLTDQSLVLYLLISCEVSPYLITNLSKDTLINYTNSQSFSVSVLASALLKRANVDFSFNNNVQPTDVKNLPECTADEVNSIFNYDINESLEWLCDIDNTLAERMWKQFHSIERLGANIERTRERLKLSLGRDGKGYPPVEIVFWQFELFFSVLNDQACSFVNILDSNDQQLFVEQMLPDLRMYLAIMNSRVPRPNWELPNELAQGHCELKEVSGDSRYNGWIQLGCIEKQYLKGQHDFSRPVELLTLFSGAAVTPLEKSSRDMHFPFMPLDDNSLWWCEGEVEVYQRPYDFWTPLIGLSKHRDWFGNQFLLVPPPEILMLLDVVPPNFGEKFEWKNSQGEPILVCRHWWVQGKQFDVESPSIQGCDIIVRPDVYNQLKDMFGCEFKLISLIKSSDV